jgi:hypothetical protein
MSVRKTVVFTTSANVQPAPARTASRLSNTRFVSSAIVPDTSFIVTGSRWTCPAVKRNPPATIPWA